MLATTTDNNTAAIRNYLESELQLSDESFISQSNRQLGVSVAAKKQSPPQGEFPSLEKLAKQSSWPADKPRQKIVFPRILQATEGTFASLWVMLDQEDIIRYTSSTRHNQFVFMSTPHPMLLWISVLYHPQLEPRWLPCYLDLKTEMGQELVRSLAKAGHYWLLFFAMHKPEHCQKMGSLKLIAEQRSNLIKWANMSQSIPVSQPQVTKKLLKQELEKLKPKILAKLKDISGTSLPKTD